MRGVIPLKYNKRTLRRVSAALVIFAVALRVVLQTGVDARAGQAVRRALSSPETAAFLFYLELGQVGQWEDGPAEDDASVQEAGSTAAPENESSQSNPSNGDKPEAASGEETAPAGETGQSAGETSGTASQEGTAQTGGQENAAQSGGSENTAQSGDQSGGQGSTAPGGTETGGTQSANTETQDQAGDTPLVFTAAEAAAIGIGGGCTYQVDKESLLLRPSYLDFDQEGPTVLIVHTHTSEAYTQEAGWEYDENETARTQNPDFSVVRVGRELAETLESHGISVIHDTSFNDYPSYNGAYDRTLTKIQQWVELYPSIQMVIDVHRDAASNADGTPVSHTAVINGESTAQLMLVMGTDQGGLWHPNWQDNLSWGLKLQAVLNRMYPGLCRDLNLRTERFNQHVTAGSMLIEVGSSGNTLRQAIAAARDLGEGLAALIEGT